MKRTPLKRNKPLNKYGTRRKSRERELDLFVEIWNERPHYSEVSGKRLLPKPSHTDEGAWRMWVSQFSHLVPKGSYRGMRLRKENIVLKTVEEHDQWHNIPKSELATKHPGWALIIDRYHENLAYANEMAQRRILYRESRDKRAVNKLPRE